jgi:hypothetical protein
VPEAHRAQFDELLIAEARLTYRVRDERGCSATSGRPGSCSGPRLQPAAGLQPRGRTSDTRGLIDASASRHDPARVIARH